jgi:hypothetical protein
VKARPVFLTFLVVTTVLAVLSVAPLFGGHPVLEPDCASTEVSRLASPDQLHDAVLFERHCGATTAFASQVSVLRRGEVLATQGGNALVVDTGQGGPAGPGRGPTVEMSWAGNDLLTLRYSRNARVISRSTTAEGIAVNHYSGLE